MTTNLRPFNGTNTEFAYQLHYHVGFRTRRCVPVLANPDRLAFLTDSLSAICDRSQYHILELDIDDFWVRLLLSLRPTHTPAKVVQTIKANASRVLFEKYPAIESEMGRRSIWSRGYYLRGVGDVTNQVVFDYIARQREHHEHELGNSRLLASFEHADPGSFFDFRPFSHCVAEYNCHIVFCPLHHVPAIEVEVANELVEYTRGIAGCHTFDIISLAVLEDHLHLFAALRPDHSPQQIALAVLNETSAWMGKRNPGSMSLWKAPGLWAPSAFVRTAGVVTTNIVRAHLKNRALLRAD